MEEWFVQHEVCSEGAAVGFPNTKLMLRLQNVGNSSEVGENIDTNGYVDTEVAKSVTTKVVGDLVMECVGSLGTPIGASPEEALIK